MNFTTCTTLKLLLCFLYLLSYFPLSILSQDSPHYYCSFIEEFNTTRTIPVRNGKSMNMKLKLEQVQILIRHGARTPTDPSSNSCYPKMRENPISWDCDYSESFNGKNNDYTTLSFNQKFDANVDDNELFGTCRAGQLISYGAEQSSELGDIIYQAYFSSETPLFDSISLEQNPELIYIRSTDVQRTRHSASVLVSTVLEKMNIENMNSLPLSIHLVDHSNDNMRGDDSECSSMKHIINDMTSSTEYKKFEADHQDALGKVASIQGQDLNFFWYWNTLDCYMSLTCNNLQEYLPEELKDVEGYPSQFAYETYHLVEEYNKFFSKWDNAVISKCVMRDFIRDFMQGFSVNVKDEPFHPSKSKFNLYSAHDSTLIYFLSAIDDLSDQKWPPYSSLLSFELYMDNNNNYYIRVIYNGRDITSGIHECVDSEIYINEGVCPFGFFIKATERSQNIGTYDNLPKSEEPDNSNSGNIFLIVILMIFSFVLGLLLYWAYDFIKTKRTSKNTSSIFA